MDLNNISKDWKGSTRQERRIIQRLLEREGKPSAIRYFVEHQSMLGDYWYWFILGTLWVSYTGWSDLDLWKKLFLAKRPNRETSLMKPDELEAFKALPNEFVVIRAHRPGEKDWISYTLSPERCAMFAKQRGVDKAHVYIVKKENIMAYFTRRGEYEILVLDKSKPLFVKTVPVVEKDAPVSNFEMPPLLTPKTKDKNGKH